MGEIKKTMTTKLKHLLGCECDVYFVEGHQLKMMEAFIKNRDVRFHVIDKIKKHQKLKKEDLRR